MEGREIERERGERERERETRARMEKKKKGARILTFGVKITDGLSVGKS